MHEKPRYQSACVCCRPYPQLSSTAFSSPLTRTRFTSLLPATSSTLFPAASVRFVHGRPCAAFRLFATDPTLFVTSFDLRCLSLLLGCVFLFASSCHGLPPQDSQSKNGCRASVGFNFALARSHTRIRVFPVDRIFRYDGILEFFRRIARFKRGTKRFNAPASFATRDNRLRRDSGDGAAQQQTFTFRKDCL